MKKDTVIEITNLGKQYKIGRQEPYLTLRDTIANLGTIPGKLFGNKKSRKMDFWALKNISLKIQQGEVVGLIGKNGSGKSTLLKILCRVTEPTIGEAIIKGKVASLLEVGTGFNPELTGRENIYLNGAILGMSKEEINRKFDQIVKFSGIATFLDTPVKRYSSGMYVRLAFSVAAHLESDILLVDEVLAVGDTEFQIKCLQKMNQVASQGRTVLFVSHNMNSIRKLCSRGIFLEKGRINKISTINSVIETYLESAHHLTGRKKAKTFKEEKGKKFQVMSVALLNHKKKIADNFECDQPVTVRIQCRSIKDIPGLFGHLSIGKEDGTTVLASDSFDNIINPMNKLAKGNYLLYVTIPPRTLGHGNYNLNLSFASKKAKGIVVDNPGHVGSFHLDDFGSKRGNKRAGFFSTLLEWHINKEKYNNDH